MNTHNPTSIDSVMNIQIEHPTDTSPSHGQDSREMELIECVRAFSATLLRDTRERERELTNFLDRLDILINPISQSTRTAPSTPGLSSGTLHAEPTELWGVTRPPLRTSSTFTFSSLDDTKYRYRSSYSSAIPQTSNQNHLHLAIPTGPGPAAPQPGAVVRRRPTPVSPTGTITLTNPFTGQPWPLASPRRQIYESDRQPNQVDEIKFPQENQSMVPPRRFGELFKIPSAESAVHAVQEVIKGTYLLALLRLPPMYFVRVGRVIHDAELSEADVEIFCRFDDTWDTRTWTGDRPPTKLATFKSSWESFAGSLIKEWKTFNVVSVLLLSSVVAILQLQTDPSSACRISALLSLLFGLMSLLYGCLYIVRFGTMKKMYSAARYVQNAKSGNDSAFWNAWVLIAMPAVWLSWSIIFFFICILSYVWQDQSGNTNGRKQMISTPSLPVQITISVVFFIGLIYFGMVVREFNNYARKDGRDFSCEATPGSRRSTMPSPLTSGLPEPPTRTPNLQQPLKPFGTSKPLQNMNDVNPYMEVPAPLRDRDVLPEDWRHYTIESLARVWRDGIIENTVEVVDVWNVKFFIPRGVQTILCMETMETNPDPTTPTSPIARNRAWRYALYVTHLPDGKPWANLASAMWASPLPEWLGDYCLEEGVQFVKPLSGAATGIHARHGT